MSAFVVPKQHLAALVDAACNTGLCYYWRKPHRVDSTIESRGALYTTLLRENEASVHHRYRDYECPATTQVSPETYTPARRRYTPVEILKAIQCYVYQSCEHPQWSESEARAFCDALTNHLIGALPGYKEAEWVLE